MQDISFQREQFSVHHSYKDTCIIAKIVSWCLIDLLILKIEIVADAEVFKSYYDVWMICWCLKMK